MAHTFKPGDRVVIVRSHFPRRIGEVTTVQSAIRRAGKMTYVPGIVPQYGEDDLVHEVTIEPIYGGGSVVLPPSWLEPYRPDHNERGEWTEELRKLCGVKENA